MRDWAGTQDVSSAILAKRGVWFTNREGETVLHGNVLATTPVDYISPDVEATKSISIQR